MPLNGINLTDGQRNHRQPGRTLGFSKPSRFDDQRSWISVRWYNFHLKNRSHNNKNSRRSFGSKNSRDDDWNRTSAGFRFHASIHHLFLDGKYRDAKTFQRWPTMLKTLHWPIRVVWVFRLTQCVALFSTEMDLAVEQITEYYGADGKPSPVSRKSNRRLAAVKAKPVMHVRWLMTSTPPMMATTMTWLDAIQLENILKGRHQIESRNSFAFSDLRHIVAKTALCDNFNAVCNKKEKLRWKSFLDALL